MPALDQCHVISTELFLLFKWDKVGTVRLDRLSECAARFAVDLTLIKLLIPKVAGFEFLNYTNRRVRVKFCSIDNGNIYHSLKPLVKTDYNSARSTSKKQLKGVLLTCSASLWVRKVGEHGETRDGLPFGESWFQYAEESYFKSRGEQQGICQSLTIFTKRLGKPFDLCQTC
ncbi:hypothetical protein M514_16434 [Trichuris suis]|uniref:Uncharacterized protein n=1 Tax=Trichuris suis TaxID=68888 RepID=A0A085NPV6_9BILA|nr:hypothetical protein M514_16434 [Trichuris suis]